MPELHVALVGTSVAIRFPEQLADDVRDQLADLVAPLAPSDPPGHGRTLTLEQTDGPAFRLRDQDELVLVGIDRQSAVASLLWRLNEIVATAADHVVVHAGCVSDAKGALVLPGPPGAGKSWLTAALIEAGFTYLSDEHTAIARRSGMIEAVPKPLDLGARGVRRARTLRPASVDPDRIPASARAVLFPQFQTGATGSLEPISAADTLLLLCTQCTNLAVLGSEAFLTLAALASRPAARFLFGDAAQWERAVRPWLEDAPSGAPLVPAGALDPVTPTTTTVALDDGLVVFDQSTGRTHLLNRAAGLVWLSARGAGAVADVVERAMDEAPPLALRPDDASDTVERLSHLGLLDLAPGPPA